MCHLRLGFVVLYGIAQRALDVHLDNGKSLSSDFCDTLLTFVREERGPQHVCQNQKTRSMRPGVHKLPKRRRRKQEPLHFPRCHKDDMKNVQY